MRLREETEFKPKPLLPIGGMPMVWHIMKTYAHYGHREFILCLGYKGEMIKDYFLKFDDTVNDFTVKLGEGPKEIVHHNKKQLAENWQVTLASTGLNADTGARLARIKDFIGNDKEFFLTYGDGVADINIDELLKYHHEKGKIATLSGVNYNSPFGIIEPQEGLVKSFQEKPISQKTFINGGFFVFNKKIFDYVTTDDNCKLEKEPLEKLSAQGELAIYEHHGFWHCMDTVKHFEDLNAMHHQKNTPWMVWESHTFENHNQKVQDLFPA